MWVPSIWFDRCLTCHPCAHPLCHPLRRAARLLRLVTDRFEALGEFALSSWFEWCKSRVFWWPESLVLGSPARFVVAGNVHRRVLPLFRRLSFLSPLPRLIWSVRLRSNGWCGFVPLRGVKFLKRP
jgi:hypothetical protein